MLLKSILIVDDSRLIAERLSTMLEMAKNVGPIRHADDYSSALRHLAEEPPDIVLLDVNLPGKSGIALLQYIKSIYSTMIVIIITNQAEDYYRRICLKMGADYFIDKSREFEQIPIIISVLP